MRFAFIIMGDFSTACERASVASGTAQIVAVPDLSHACTVAKELQTSGVDCIELCGAFGKSGAEAVIAATKKKIPVGYITHLPEQDKLYKETFGH